LSVGRRKLPIFAFFFIFLCTSFTSLAQSNHLLIIALCFLIFVNEMKQTKT
jgi:hypothetical protein